MNDPRPILRVRLVSPEQARRARAEAWSYILRCYDEGRTPQRARDQKPPDTRGKFRAQNTR